MPYEELKRKVDLTGDNQSEDYVRMKQNVSTAGLMAESGMSTAMRKDIVRALQTESNRYIAGDLFFVGQPDRKNSVRGYIEQAKANGIKEGFTVGVSKAFDDVAKNPKDYYIKGTYSLDEDKILEKIAKSEKYKIRNNDALISSRGRTNQAFDVPENKRFRKKREKATSYGNINQVEHEMKAYIGKGLFSKEEEIVLAKNNAMFQFRSVRDIDRTSAMIDKYIVKLIKKTKISDGEKIITLQGSGLFKIQEINTKDLSKMSAKDVAKLIKKLKGIDPDETKYVDLINALKAKKLLAISSDKIQKLSGKASLLKAGIMMGGGNEIMRSEIGEGIRYAYTGMKLEGKGVVTAAKTGKLAANLTIKAADFIVPNQTAAVRTAKKKITRAGASLVQKRVARVQNLRAVKGIKSAQQTIHTGIEKLSSTQIGKATKFIGKYTFRGVKFTNRILSLPFVIAGNITNFVKRKVIMPVIIVCGGIFILLYIVASLGGMGGEAVSSTIVLILSETDQFADYQARYDACDQIFQNQVSGIVNGFAQTSNLKGEKIQYGINSAPLTDHEVELQGEYKNGVTLSYYYDGNTTSGISSNIEDCLSAMTVIMQQNQSIHHTEALELLEAIYKSTHSYSVFESALYPCTNGCAVTQYYCNECQVNQSGEAENAPSQIYWSTDMKYNPWLFSTLVKPSSEQECAVCKDNDEIFYSDYAGCTVTGTCFHGTDGNMGRSHSGCDNYSAVWDCTHSCNNENCTHDCSGRTLGCGGYYECMGHNHYGCPNGHYAATCFGHVDLTMNVNIASLNRIFTMGGVSIIEEQSNESTSDEQEGIEDEPSA